MISLRIQSLELPTLELQIPPMPNSTSLSLGSVKQSMKSSKTLSCKITQVHLVNVVQFFLEGKLIGLPGARSCSCKDHKQSWPNLPKSSLLFLLQMFSETESPIPETNIIQYPSKVQKSHHKTNNLMVHY